MAISDDLQVSVNDYLLSEYKDLRERMTYLEDHFAQAMTGANVDDVMLRREVYASMAHNFNKVDADEIVAWIKGEEKLNG